MSYAAHRRDFGSLVGRTPFREAPKRGLLAPVASRLAELRFTWKQRAGRRRLARSIAHLDDRLLADIGLGPDDLGFAERLARRRATGVRIWAGSKAGSSTDRL
jgi:uncharacterized protein YjiS (DUF1127 family)